MSELNSADIKRYMDIKRVNGQSDLTIKVQKRLLEDLSDFLSGKSFKDAAEQNVMEYLAHKRETVNEVTLQTLKVVIKSFYRFIYGSKKREYPDQVSNLTNGNHNKRKSPIRPEEIITKDDIAYLIKYCKNFRDEAILVALYESGCRISEFTALDIGHLVFDEKGLVMLVSGKTGTRRIRLIESVPYIQKWVENHPLKNDKNAPLWVTLKKSYPEEKGKNARLRTYTISWVLSGLKRGSQFSKPLNPHAFRHSRITELAKFLSDGKLKVFAGWTGGSPMAGLYVHLGGRDLDDDLLKIAGVEIKEQKKESPLRAKECSRCHHQNPGTAEFCLLCGRPFNESLVIGQALEEQKLKEEVEVLRGEVQKTEGVGEYLDYLHEQIEQLQKQLVELRNGGSTD